MVDISKLDIDKLVEFVNIELQKNKTLSVNKLCDKYDIKKATLKTRMRRGGYSYNQDHRRYEKAIVDKNTTSSTTETHNKHQTNTTSSTTIKSVEVQNKNMPNNIDMDKLNLLLDNIDSILELVKYKNTTSSITLNSKETKVTSLRINAELYDKVKERATRDQQSISDIVNRALIDYLKNYI